MEVELNIDLVIEKFIRTAISEGEMISARRNTISRKWVTIAVCDWISKQPTNETDTSILAELCYLDLADNIRYSDPEEDRMG